MRRWIFYTALAGLCSIGAESQAEQSVAPGFLEGRLKVDVSGGARLADDDSEAARVNYAEYPMVVLRKHNREEVARVTADENGHYRIPLPPGEYLLEIKSRGRKRAGTQQRPFTVVSQQTARVDMEVLPDLSVSGAPR
jgi:Carboxypeptidase regulatory-like domain